MLEQTLKCLAVSRVCDLTKRFCPGNRCGHPVFFSGSVQKKLSTVDIGNLPN